MTGIPSWMLNGQLVIIKFKELQILSSWLFGVFLGDPFLLTLRLDSDFLWIWLTDLEIFFGSVPRKIRRHWLLLFLLWRRRLYIHLHTASLGWSLIRSSLDIWFAHTLALRFFLFLFAWTRWLLSFRGFWFVIGNMFFSSVSVIKLLFFTKCETLPFLDDFGHEFRFSHSWELVSILVVFLSWKLSIKFCQLFLLQFALHCDFE